MIIEMFFEPVKRSKKRNETRRACKSRSAISKSGYLYLYLYMCSYVL